MKPHRLRLVTDAASEPISLADAKTYCRVDTADEDFLIRALISAARRHIERITGLALLTQSWAAVFDGWPGYDRASSLGEWWDGVREGPIAAVLPNGALAIDKRPFQSVTAVRTRDSFGVTATVDASVYHVVASDMRGEIILKQGQVWPATILSPRGGVEVEFRAGFDHVNFGGLVPDDLMTALKVLVKHWYDNREPASDGELKRVPNHVDEMLRAWRPMRLS